MGFHIFKFLLRKLSGLKQYGIRYCNLSDIMQGTRRNDYFNPLSYSG